MDLYRIFLPLSSNFFQHDEEYSERLPGPALAPYVRCFWGTAGARLRRFGGDLVIPDTCMDIIFHVDYAGNRLSSVFCALDEHSYRTPASRESGGRSATFAIRFYAWTACLFAEDSLQGSVNGRFPPEAFFRRIESALAPLLFDEPTLEGKAHIAERVLRHLMPPREALRLARR